MTALAPAPFAALVAASFDAREYDPTFRLERLVTEARKLMGPERWSQLQAEWNETDRLIERARVEHGFCTPAYRKAVRAIIARQGEE